MNELCQEVLKIVQPKICAGECEKSGDGGEMIKFMAPIFVDLPEEIIINNEKWTALNPYFGDELNVGIVSTKAGSHKKQTAIYFTKKRVLKVRLIKIRSISDYCNACDNLCKLDKLCAYYVYKGGDKVRGGATRAPNTPQRPSSGRNRWRDCFFVIYLLPFIIGTYFFSFFFY